MSAVGAPPSVVSAVVLGPAGLVHEAFEWLLLSNGVEVRRAGAEAEGEAGAAAERRRVTVLIDATNETWAEAASLGDPVVLVITGAYEKAVIVDAVLRGAEAVMHVDTSPDALVSAVVDVAHGGTVLGPAEVRALAGIARAAVATPDVRLTKREVDIVESIAKGHAVKQTARSLGISPKTVENLQSRLFRKLGVHNRAQAVAQAHALGVV